LAKGKYKYITFAFEGERRGWSFIWAKVKVKVTFEQGVPLAL